MAVNGLTSDRIMRLSDRGKEHAQVVVNLRGRRDRGTRIRSRTALLNRDRRRKTLDKIDVRLFHFIEKLPGVSRQTLDVTPLPFGVERIERERRFARAAQTRDNNQLFSRNLEMEILEIVLAGTADLDSFCWHRNDKGR